MDPLSNLAFTTSGALIELVDKKVLVNLRDGRKLIGVLRSYDQYANLVLTMTIERLYHPPTKSYAETDRGVFLIRGENVVLLGEVDLDAEDAPLTELTQLPWSSLESLLAKETKAKEKLHKKKEALLWREKGFGVEGGDGDNY
ncbi:LSM-domain-containing protein [Meredithblackwellia eburnea MCA 4105]